MEEVKGTGRWWQEYKRYISSAEWKKKREKCFKRDGYECRICGSKADLQCHHKTYVRVGGEEPNDLTTLCEKCHGYITGMMRRRRKWTKTTTMYDNILIDVPELIL